MKDKCSECGGKGFICLLFTKVVCTKCTFSSDDYENLPSCPEFSLGITIDGDFNSGNTLPPVSSDNKERIDHAIAEGTFNGEVIGGFSILETSRIPPNLFKKTPCLEIHKGYEDFMHSIDEFLVAIEDYKK